MACASCTDEIRVKVPSMTNFQNWCIRNYMVVNVPKTTAMFLASRTAANKILENRPDLKLSDETINISTKDQRTNGPVNAHLISGPRISTKYTKPGKNKVKK